MRRRLILELFLLCRGWTTGLGIALILMAGTIAIAHGRTVIGRQQAALAESPALQAEEQAAILKHLPPTALAGDQLYYLYFHTTREPSPWAPIVIGQRDVQPFNLKIRLLALQGQLYDTELGSPLLASFGNFDLAFVFVVLAPLLVIALTFNLWSVERETGTWDLLRSQSTPAARVIGLRYALSGFAAWLPLLLLQSVATVVFALPVNTRWATTAAAILAYTLFWVCVSAVVALLRRGSDVNVLILLTLWAVSSALGPATVSVAATALYPLPEAMELTVLQRQGYHSAWDRPLGETMAAFYERYPEWKAVPIPRDQYSNGWYYAMQQRGDDAAQPAAERYRSQLQARDGWTARASIVFPSAVLHRLLTRVAGTDLDSYLGYLDSVAAYHESLKRHFYPMVFSNTTVGAVDWRAAPRHHYRDR